MIYTSFRRLILRLATIFICLAAAILIYCYLRLPTVSTLMEVRLQTPLRILSQDGALLAEYGEQRRQPIHIEDIPHPLILAIVATEDRRFYQHHGVDMRGLLRAFAHLVRSGTKEQGGSTITMQVARNFFLSRQKTFGRKIKEIMLAFKIENELSKDQIMELYLNKIYFGKNAYGIAAAAQVYYGKPVQLLTLGQLAILAGLPQAPSALNPINNPKGALRRRDHVLARMYGENFITKAAYEAALQEPIAASYHDRGIALDAPYAAEHARRWLVEQYGESVYTQGLTVYTTIRVNQQRAAQYAVQEGLRRYDQRHGYHGPLQTLAPSQDPVNDWLPVLQRLPHPVGLTPGVVISVNSEEARVLLDDEREVTVDKNAVAWAQRHANNTDVSAVLHERDVIYLHFSRNQWQLSQVPEIGGALVALDPKDGAITALVGGYDLQQSHFNRATQALRQPGSTFKTFLYAAALEEGLTAATLINDAPIVSHDLGLEDVWRPQNDQKEFYGPTRLRMGVVRSLNLLSIRVLEAIGIDAARKHLTRWGFEEKRLPQGLALALGVMEQTPLDMASHYALFANGGYAITPYIVHHVEDSHGNVIYTANPAIADCPNCVNPAPSVMSRGVAYIMTSMLQEAIQQGSGRAAKQLGRADIAGKTGTTNSHKDAWYAGYNQNVVCITWMGFDTPQSLREYASNTTLPMWIAFMQPTLRNIPDVPWHQPPGIVTMRIDPKTGLLAHPNQKDAIFELFLEGHVPSDKVATPTKVERPSKHRSEPLF